MPTCRGCVLFPFEKTIHCCVVDGGCAKGCSDPYRRTVVRRMWERSDLLPKQAKSHEESKYSFGSASHVVAFNRFRLLLVAMEASLFIVHC